MGTLSKWRNRGGEQATAARKCSRGRKQSYLSRPQPHLFWKNQGLEKPRRQYRL